MRTTLFKFDHIINYRTPKVKLRNLLEKYFCRNFDCYGKGLVLSYEQFNFSKSPILWSPDVRIHACDYFLPENVQASQFINLG